MGDELRPRRTTLAAALVGAAILIPLVAWYLAGTSAAREQGERLLERPLSAAKLDADRLAHSIGLQLEALRDAESRRPHTDYRPADAPFTAGCLIEEPLSSSLAMGPKDPLIWAYFQIDPVGQLTLPTSPTGDEVDAETSEPVEALNAEIAEALECAANDYLQSIERTAHKLGRRIVEAPEGTVIVGPFSWHTVTLEGKPALVALRGIDSPLADLTQGFVVKNEVLTDLVSEAPYPAVIRPGEPNDETQAALPLSGEEWTIELDTSIPLAKAEAEAATIVNRFRRSFAVGAAIALLAGLALIVVVYRVERLAAERARFAASAAHELRTPLAGMRMYAEMLAEGLGSPEKRDQYANRISAETDRLGRVVTNVLGFSQLQRDGVQVRPEPGDLGAATSAAVAQLAPAIEAAGAEVELEIQDDLPAIPFDSDAVHQILQNLIDNAEKYSREANNRTIEVALSANGAGPVLSVRDYGPGVDRALRRRLFEPFERTSNPDLPAGLGVGLALVRALAQAQGATVRLADPEGGGSRFEVHFSAC